jgi:hypothetical protein
MDATGANLPLKKMQFKIDTAKKEREVAEIVESDEFKLLEQQVSKFRNQSETASESGLQPVLKTNISEPDRLEVALKASAFCHKALLLSTPNF